MIAIEAEPTVISMAAAGQMEVVPWTQDQYRRAVNEGWLPEDTGTELLDGFIVRKDRSAVGEDPMNVGDRHRIAVLMLARLGPQFESHGCFVQTQQPVALSNRHEPEPDAAVVRGAIEDYRDGPPGPGHLLCVVGVSDSSLLRDTTIKLRACAAAGVPVYVVVDLPHDVVRVHRDPRPAGTYALPVEFRRGDVLALPAGGAAVVEIAVDRLL